VIPKLADFGVAKSYAAAGGTWHTKHGTRLGTLMFMPPEQVRDAASVGVPADIYAIGVTLYYLLTGQYSFTFPSQIEAAAHREGTGDLEAALRALMRYHRIKHPFSVILEDEPVPVRERTHAVSVALAQVVDRAVRKDPAARFASAAAFRDALTHAL
jgi:serine/threonine-protein kinase